MGDERTVEGVGLPHFVGVGLGKGQPVLVPAVVLRLEQFVLLDHPPERIGRDLGSREQPLLNAQAIEQGQRRGFAVGFGLHFAEGLQQVFQRHLADFALVGTGLVFHDRDTVFLVTGEPGLDGAPGELAGLAILVGEGHLADGLDPGLDVFALGQVNGSKYAHFQISSGISHE
jgi:hypothetical protein